MKVLKKDQAQIILQIIISVLLFRFVLFENTIQDLGLSQLYYFLFLIAIGVIMYGGILLYRVVLQEEFPTKNIEKDTEKAYYKYLAVNVVGIGISFFVANSVDKPIILVFSLHWQQLFICT